MARKHWMSATGVVSGAIAVLGAVQVMGTPAHAEEDPARVAGVSYWLDAFETGARVTPGITNGLVSTVLSTQQMPPPLDQVQAQALQAMSDAAVASSVAGPDAIDQLRTAIAPLACANPQINDGINGFADGIDALVEAVGSAIQPLDRTIAQLSVLIRASQEPGEAPGC